MKLSTTQNRILGAILFGGAFLLAHFFDGTFTGFAAGAMAGAGVILMIFGNLRPNRRT